MSENESGSGGCVRHDGRRVVIRPPDEVRPRDLFDVLDEARGELQEQGLSVSLSEFYEATGRATEAETVGAYLGVQEARSWLEREGLLVEPIQVDHLFEVQHLPDGRTLFERAWNEPRAIQLPDGTEVLTRGDDIFAAATDQLLHGMCVWRENDDGTHSRVPPVEWPSRDRWRPSSRCDVDEFDGLYVDLGGEG